MHARPLFGGYSLQDSAGEDTVAASKGSNWCSIRQDCTQLEHFTPATKAEPCLENSYNRLNWVNKTDTATVFRFWHIDC